MSHRITTQTQINNKKLAITALKAAGWNFSEHGANLSVHDGPMRGASINTSTGNVTGDTDYGNHRGNGLKALNKHYSEALIRMETQKQGGQIIERTVVKNQDIVLIAQYG